MTKEQFESVLRIPTCSRHEDMMQEFLLEWASKHGYSAKKDSKGNILMSKGQTGPGKYAVGLINHIDSVHNDQEEMVKQHVYKEIVWEGDKVTAINPLLPKRGGFSSGWATSWRKDDKKSVKQPSLFDKDAAVDVEQKEDGTYEVKDDKKDYKSEEKKSEEKEQKKEEKPVEMGRQTGLGMDNQGGCAIALAVMEGLPVCRAAFTVEEELGMLGAKAMDMSFFDDCAFVFSNDSPDRNRGTHYSSGVQLYSDKFFKEHLEKICAANGLTNFRSEPFTCILNVRRHRMPDGKHIECLNFGNGGYNPHQDTEYAKFSHVNAAEKLLRDLCTEIPLDRQYTSDIGEMPRPKYDWSGYSGRYSGGYSRWGGGSGYGARRSAYPSSAEFKDGDGKLYGFTWVFSKGAAVRNRYVERVGRLLSPDVKIAPSESISVKAEGPLAKIKTAWRFAFNYDNDKAYMSWEDLVKDTPGAEKAFKDSVKEVSATDAGDAGVSDDAEAAAMLQFDDSDTALSFQMDLADSGVPVEMQEDGGTSLALAGTVGDLKRAYVMYWNVVNNESVNGWEELRRKAPRQTDEFLRSLELDATDTSDDSEYTQADLPDFDVEPEDDETGTSSDMDDFWKWFDENR